MNKFINNEKGSTLALILIAIVVLSILGTALLQTSLAENNFALREEDRLKAYYIAKAGAEVASTWIEDPSHDVSTINTLITTNSTNTAASTDFADGKFWVSFSGNQYQPTVHSLGEHNGVQQKVNLSLDKNHLFDAAVTVTNTLTLGNNSAVIGDVATMQDPSAAIPYNQHNITGNISQIIKTFPDPTDPLLPPSPFPPSYTITNGDAYANHNFGNVNLNNNTLNIILTGDMELQFNNFETKGTINVTGSGNLVIYTNTLDFKANLNTDSTAKTTIVVFNGGVADFKTGNSTFEGFIYGPNADMTISANMASVGAIVAKNLSITSGGEVHYGSSTGNLYPEDLGFPSQGYSRTIWSD